MRMTTSRRPSSRAVCFVLLALLLMLVWACGSSGSTLDEGAPREGSSSLGDCGPVIIFIELMSIRNGIVTDP
jgi:hypothetical protein